MKRMKKLMATVLALAMVMSLTMFAHAANTTLVATATGDNTIESVTLTAEDTYDTLLTGAVISVGFVMDDDAWTVSTTKTGLGVSKGSGLTINLVDTDTDETIGTLTLVGDDVGTADISATITIAAAGGGNGGGGGNNEAGEQGVTNLDNPATGGGSGKGLNEGGDPAKVINVILPTVSDNAYNMILDAHGLLNDTNFARLGTLTGDDATISIAEAAKTKHLFFNAGQESGKTVYGQDSIEIPIYNKSQIDVDVTLDAEMEKNEASVSFVASDGLSAAEGAAMYLAVVNTPVKGTKAADDYTVPSATTTALTDGEGKATAQVKTTIKAIDVFKRDVSDAGVYSYIVDTSKLSEGTPNTDYNSTKFKLTGDINTDDAWDSVASNKLELTLTWKVEKAAAAVVVADADPSYTVTQKAAAQNDFATLTVSLGSGEKAAASFTALEFTGSTGSTVTWDSTATNLTVDGNTVTFKVTSPLTKADAAPKLVFTKADETTVEIDLALADYFGS